jgi:16S rRNA (cytosine1407-C5)-methyltransferase
MDNVLPEKFSRRLEEIVPEVRLSGVLESFRRDRPVSLRVNTLKTTVEEARARLEGAGISCGTVDWCPEALLLARDDYAEGSVARELEAEGHVYAQGLSSLLVPLVLGPRPGETVLDLCAAPGSKTGQIAAMMGNTGRVIANEPVRGRYYKLKSVLELLGVANTELTMSDGRRLRRPEMFDRVLVDAPCGSEGRFRAGDKKSFGYWSERKIREMARKQRGLVLNALRLLKPGGTMVYSTCTFSPEENEGVIDWLLRKAGPGAGMEAFRLPGGAVYPALERWKNKVFHPDVGKMARVLPDGMMTGFVVARIRKPE